MGKLWTDLKNGQWKLAITSEDSDGTPPSVFYGTKEEILDKMADAQANANKRLSQLRRGQVPPAVSPSPKPLTAADRMTAVAELQNPATVDKAVTRVLESVMGPVDGLRQDRAEEREEREQRIANQAATTFAEGTPDWFPSDHNKNTLVGYMKRMGLSPTNASHYTQAFEELSAAQLLQAKPMETVDNNAEFEPRERERNAPTPTPSPRTPTRFSTAIRQSDISGQAPKPTTQLKYTREQIASMSAAIYKRLMTSSSELSRCVEYYEQQDRRKRRAS